MRETKRMNFFADRSDRILMQIDVDLNTTHQKYILMCCFNKQRSIEGIAQDVKMSFLTLLAKFFSAQTVFN